MLKHENENHSLVNFFSSDIMHQDLIQYRPYLRITYLNQSGIEGYLSYTTMGLGRSGSAAVNNYNGNMVYTHSDVALSGNRLPLSISHVYNTDARGTNLGYGFGWRLNVHQTLFSRVIEQVNYMQYTDGDGTIHYFKWDTTLNKYLMETPGVFLTLTKNADNSHTIKDSQENKLTFNPSGYLIEIRDNQGNIMQIEWTNNRVSKVTDGAGRIAVLTYSNNLLTTISYPSSRSIQFAYSSNNLTKIIYPDSLETVFQYSSSRITRVTHPSGQYLAFTYDESHDVKTMTQHSSTATISQRYTFQYWFNATSVTNHQGKTATYLFNNEGNAVNVIDPAGNVAHYNFNDNQILNYMPPRATTINLLKNHNFERIASWTLANEGGSASTSSYATDQAYHGSQSLKIVKTNTTGLSLYRQTAVLEWGKTYSLSAHLKTEAISNTDNKGAVLLVRYTNAAGTTIEQRSTFIRSASTWQRLFLSFTVPADASSTNVTVVLALEGETGTVWYDNVQLEEGHVPTSYNLVENGHFEWDSNSNGIPDQWSTANLVTGDRTSTSEAKFGINSFRIAGANKVDKNISQVLNVSGQAGETFVLGGWAKGSSVPRNDLPAGDSLASEPKHKRYFALCLGFFGDTETKWEWRFFNDDYTGWQYLSAAVQAPINYNTVRVYAAYYHNANVVYFDGIQVSKEPVTSFMYDANGNIISIKDANNNQTSFTYNSSNDIIRMSDPKGGNYTYAYDTKHNVLSAFSPAGTAYSFTHDSYGNIATSSYGHLQNENLVTNGNFENHNLGWGLERHNNTGLIAVQPGGSVGNSALSTQYNPTGGESYASAYQEIAVKGNTTYTLSSFVKTELNTAKAYLVIEEYNVHGQLIKVTPQNYAALGGQNDWTPRAITVKTLPNTTRVRVHLRVSESPTEPSSNPNPPAPSPDAYYQTVNLAPAKDAGTTSSAPTTNYGTANWLSVGRDSSGNIFRSALGFTLPAPVKGKKIVEARLYLYTRQVSGVSASTTSAQVWDAISAWTESGTTYNNFPANNNPEAVNWSIPGQTTDGAEVSVNITAMVQRWADEYNSDINGLILMQKATTNNTLKSFYSQNHTNTAYRPKLVITYDTRDNYRIISPSDDARVRSANTTGNFGSQGFTSAGVHPEIADAQSWFKFPLTSIPAGKTITKATLELVEYASGYSVATSSAVTIHRSLANWSEGTITWSNKPSYNSTSSASLTIGAQTDFGIRQWDVTQLMNDFYTGVHANHGFVMVSAHSKYFNTKEFADVFRRPRLRVEFSDTDTEAPQISFSPAWSDNTLSVALGFTDNIAYKDHRYAWTTSAAKPTSIEWSSWSTTSSPTYTRTTSGNWYLHVEARDTANNVAYSFAGPYTTQGPGATETAWFDAVQLEVGDRVSSFNLLTNTGLEKLSGTLPAGYKATNQTGTVTITSDTATKFSGARSVKLVSSGSNVGYLELNNQDVALKPNTKYTLSFWVYGTNITSGTTLVSLRTRDSAGNLSNDLVNYHQGGTLKEWRNITTTFTTPSSARTLGTLRFGFNTAGSGTVWFDDITLKEESTTIRALYTTDGNYLRQIQDAEGKAVVTYNYTEEDLLRGVYSSVTDAKGNVQNFTYDVFNRVTGVTDNTTGTSQSYTYNNQDNLSTITREDFTYTFEYNNFGYMTKVNTPAHTLVTNTYANRGLLTKTTFGNGQAIDYTYNNLDQLKDVRWNNATRYSYEYDARGNIVLVTDNVNNTATWYTYDLADRLLNFREVSTLDNSQIRYVTYDYDKNNKATKILETIGTITYTTSFTYNKDNTVASITTNYGEKLEFFYNEKGMPDRTVRKVNNQPHSYTNYRYNQRGLLTMLEHSKGRYNYSHDQNGNITGIVGPGSSHNYTYDALNQLLSERITANGEVWEIVYTYDKLGNMTTRTEGSNQVQYSYTYDRLTQIRTYQNGVLQNTQNLTYDNAGNVTNDGEYTYTWQMGRQLAGMSKPGLTTSYQYNENGLRTEKIVNGAKTEYTYMGSNVTREVIRNTQGSIVYTIYYSYASGNSPTSMNVNGVNYYFLKNAQGDITHILNASGNEVGAYEYDAWGNILSVIGGEIAELNPYRYRGYRYDSETGFYYLQSRYYNPAWGRFINADCILAPGHLANMFVYSINDPVNLTDHNGMNPFALPTIDADRAGSGAAPLPASPYMADALIDAFLCIGTGILAAINGTRLVRNLKEKLDPNWTVYALADADGKIKYAGRTQNYKERMTAHGTSLRANLLPHRRLSGLNYFEARIMEQAWITEYSTLNVMDKVMNQRNGIFPPRLALYKAIAEQSGHWLNNQVTNELYNLLGK